ALDFDGVDDYVATASNISELDITGDITIQSWVNVSSLPSEWTRFVGKGYNNSRTYGLWLSTSGKLLLQTYGGGQVNLSSNTALQTGAWYHILATKSGNTATIYVNGVATGTATFSGTANSSTDPLTFGKNTDHTRYPGLLDEVAIWDKGLSAAEVTTLYNSGGGLDASSNSGNYNSANNLVGYWKMDDGSGTSLTDSSGNSNTATMINMSDADWVDCNASYCGDSNFYNITNVS
ncbi:uncharacterized protein METZ01_LOCUS499326, partial [marine metagenome]